MQKSIRTMGIVATALVAFSLILLVVTLPLQPFILKIFYNSFSELPIFPIIEFFSCLFGLFAIILLIVFGGKKDGKIWPELIVCILLAIVLPMICSISNFVYSLWITNIKSSYYYASMSYARTIANFCMIPSKIGVVLAYITCGMSIAFKKLSKNQ